MQRTLAMSMIILALVVTIVIAGPAACNRFCGIVPGS